MTVDGQSRNGVDRRTFLRGAAAGATTLGVAGAASAPAAAQSDDLDEWLADTDNYDEVADRTGATEVGVDVGTSANGGAFGFGPAAIRVDPGTTVVWEWTGKGGSHDVAAEDGSFQSEMTGDTGHTFSHTFEETGVYRYACTPHAPMGMKGAVIVGGAAGAGQSAPAAGDESGRELLLVGALGGAVLTVLGLLPISASRKRARAHKRHRGQ